MYWLLYDIPDNRKRNKLAQICMDFGLRRVQKSCFLGDVDKKLMSSFCQKLDNLLDSEDQVCMIPVTDKDVRETVVWGDEEDFESILDTGEVCFI